MCAHVVKLGGMHAQIHAHGTLLQSCSIVGMKCVWWWLPMTVTRTQHVASTEDIAPNYDCTDV